MMGGRIARVLPALTIAAVIVAAAGWLLLRSEALRSGPEEIVWNHTQCAECRMSVTDRPWAAQLQTIDGRVLNFDDPGCLFQYQIDERPEVHAIWFRHVREDRWLAEADAAFIETGPSPMGYGLGAVAAGAAGTMSVAEARARIVRPEAAEGGETSHAH